MFRLTGEGVSKTPDPAVSRYSLVGWNALEVPDGKRQAGTRQFAGRLEHEEVPPPARGADPAPDPHDT